MKVPFKNNAKKTIHLLSMNPELDVGQVEGAHMMGLGMFLSEKLIYDPQTGRNLTNGTWVGMLIIALMVIHFAFSRFKTAWRQMFKKSVSVSLPLPSTFRHSFFK